MDWSSDSDDDDKFDWENDCEAEPLSASALSNLDASGPSTLDASGWTHGEAPSSSLVEEYVGKGFQKETVLKAIKAIGNNDANALRSLLLAYKALGDYPLVGNYLVSGCTHHDVEDDDDIDFDFGNWDGDHDAVGESEANSHGSIAKDLQQDMLENDMKIKSLVDVGFHEDEANMIITRCGVGASFFVLVDSKNLPHHEVANMSSDSFGGRKKEKFKKEGKKKRKPYGDREQKKSTPYGW